MRHNGRLRTERLARTMATSRKRPAADPTESASSPTGGGSDNVWLAGMGALAQAQARGTQAFDALVREGLAQQAKAREAAETEMNKAAERLSAMTMGGANPWDRLGGIFEGRVQQALQSMGMPSPEWLAALQQRIDALEARVAELEGGAGTGTRTASRARGKSRTDGN